MMTYNEAVKAYQQTVGEDFQQPSITYSVSQDGRWRLANVNGELARVSTKNFTIPSIGEKKCACVLPSGDDGMSIIPLED